MNRMRIHAVDRPLVRANVELWLTERGKIVPGSRRRGHNVWTFTGREYLAQVITPALGWAGRDDKVNYMGVGEGSQPEVASVDQLVANIEYTSGLYLKAIQSIEFPNDPATSTAFLLEFDETEINDATTPKEIREIGLFTSDMLPGTPDQAPVAYKTFEPLTKTEQFRLSVRWEVRFR
jgi:hypothetical protein